MCLVILIYSAFKCVVDLSHQSREHRCFAILYGTVEFVQYSQGWSVRNQVTGLTTLISEIEVEIGETTTLISKFQKL